MISGQWFYRRRIGQKLHKITHKSMENRGSTPNLTNLVGVHPRNIHTKLKTNLYSGSRDEVKNGILHILHILHIYITYITYINNTL